MIQFDNGGILVERTSELPNFKGARSLFLDFETTSCDPKLDSLNPWKNCWIAGAAITVDDAKNAWYIPSGHTPFLGGTDPNLPWEAFLRFMEELFELPTLNRWVNHNVKYDAHVLTNCTDIHVPERIALVDTVVLAKLLDSDRVAKGGYGLDALADGWLHENIRRYEAALQPYLGKTNKDYGRIPVDICGEYACQDVLTNRRLLKYIEELLPEQCSRVRDNEIRLTTILYEIEREGLPVDPTELALTEYKSLNTLLEIDDKLTKITGRSFRPNVSEDCYEVLCVQYGLPVFAYTQDDSGNFTTNPSFDKEAMAKYAAYPYSPKDVIELMMQYKREHTFMSNFAIPYQHLHVDGILHSVYNQRVRTGRLSSKWPNSQQLSPRARALIHPRDGYSIMAFDYSQIEFRLIVHYIQDQAAIAAYNENPDTDFHQLVADWCGIPRKPAKTVNFCIGYGGGKRKVLSMLSREMELMASLKTQVDQAVQAGKITEQQQVALFNNLCTAKANEVYNRYHSTLPGLRQTARNAELALLKKGYVFTVLGSHRHLPREYAYKAFNTLNQGSAADLVKEQMITLYDAIKGTPIKMIAQVHDEITLMVPTELANDPRTAAGVLNILEHPKVPLRVPLRCTYGVSDDNWYAAKEQELLITYDPGADLSHCV